MTRKTLLAAAAAISILSFASGAQACCLDHTLRHVGDGVTRTGDCLFGWMFRKHC